MPQARTKQPQQRFTEDGELALDPRALNALYSPWEDQPEYAVVNGVAIVEINGPLSQRGGWWWDGYESVRARFEQAVNDRTVNAVLLKINSPGGVVAGCFENVRAMRIAAELAGKPVVAYADECAYSAAYALACVADTIILPPSGGVGSVGVIGTLTDWSKNNEMLGIRVAVVKSGQAKDDSHPDSPLTKEAIQRMQTRVDYLAGLFADWVAERRGSSRESILGLEAMCFDGPDALKAGLADQVGNLDTALSVAVAAGGKRTMKGLLAALDLPETASEGEGIAKVISLKGQLSQLEVLQKNNGELSAQIDEYVKKELITEGMRASKLTPAILESDDWKKLSASCTSEQLRLYISAMQPQLPHAVKQPEAVPASSESPTGTKPLSAEQEAVRKQLGLSVEEFLAK